MVLPRPTVLRAFAPARLFRSAPRTARAVQRRGYASGHGGHAEPSSDVPWAIGAVAATVPTCWYLWPSGSHADAHHDDHQPETQHERAEKLTHEADEAEPAETEEKPTPESKGSTDDVQFKGKSAAGDEDNKVDDTRKVEDDSKGAKKLRIDSDSAKKLDAPAEGGAEGDMSSKQKGLSTTDTKHSTDIANDDSKSNKGEGIPETAKTQGTVSVDRPHIEKQDETQVPADKKDDHSAEKKEDKPEEKKSDDKPEEKSDDKPEEKSEEKPEEKKDE